LQAQHLAGPPSTDERVVTIQSRRAFLLPIFKKEIV